MKKPKMILFDYGGTLIQELGLDGIKGTRAVMEHVIRNPRNLTAEQVQAVADQLNEELRIGRETVEFHNHHFNRYLYASLGIELDIDPEETERCFWDGASSLVPTEGIAEFLGWLKERGIRSAVVSNISFSGQALEERIRRALPENSFEFILASSEVVFRKPSPRIFQLALTMANLAPEDVWYCGDSVKYDVNGANNAGLTPIWYTGALKDKPKEAANCLTIRCWDELKRFID